MRYLKIYVIGFIITFLYADLSAQRSGYRLRRYTAGLTYSHIVSNSSVSDFKLGYSIGFAKCFPVLLYKVKRHNDKPLLYINAGISFTGIGSKKNSAIKEDTLLLLNYDASLMYANLPLSFEINFYQNRFKGLIVNPENSFVSIEGGIQFSYLLQSKINNGSENRDFKSQTSKNDFQWFAGLRLLQTQHGLSLDLKYYKGLQSVFTSDSFSRNEYYLITLSWNRMESRCANSHRKMKRTIKVLNKIG